MLTNYLPHRCYIIAEIGGNFTTFEQARNLIDLAADSGVDAVKLQTYRADTIVNRKALFDLDNIGRIPQHEFFRQFEINEELHRQVFDYIRRKNLDWFSTPSHPSDVELLERLEVPAYKIGADDATNLPLLQIVASKQKPLFLSTGLCTLAEIKEALDCILATGNRHIYLFHTVSNYPTKPDEVNLKAIQTLQETFSPIPVGFSDHTIGPMASIFAAVLGARFIEKHFTWDKHADGPDHLISATPDEMKSIVEAVRAFEIMRGDGIKTPVGKEVGNRLQNRKSLVLIKAVAKGQALTPAALDIKRPGFGIAPKHIDRVIGCLANRDLEADEVLQWKDIH
ncbi:MAG: N-acetylneuraminate synthase family protein [Desulfobacterales bacterium]|nr:N-acetylneuraminate synthase family protein [Desulfobacterales bacterium]